jgi:hypothetical protein
MTEVAGESAEHGESSVDQIDEAELMSAARSGVVLNGTVEGVMRSVEADLLRACCHELGDEVDPRGLRLKNAVVAGCLDLTGLVVAFPLRFDGCEFASAPVLEGSELFELSFIGCPRVPGLLGNGLRLRRDLDLSGSRVAGVHRTSASTSNGAAIWLCESNIDGRLLCIGTTIDGRPGCSIQADRLHVGGAVRLIDNFRAMGEIRLLGARIGGSLDLRGAQIDSSGGLAIDLGTASIEGSVFLVEDHNGRGPVIRGLVNMRSASIAGQLMMRRAIVEAPSGLPRGSIYRGTTAEGTAIDGPRLSVGAEVTLAEHCEVKGRIGLPMATISSMSIGADCILRAPGRTALDLTASQIGGLLRLDEEAKVEGTMRLAGAVIHGSLALHGSMKCPERRSLVGGSAMTVDGDVYLDGLRTTGGRVNFRGATLGMVSAPGATLCNPAGYTISLHQALVKGSVLLTEGFTSTGLAVLNRSTIEGRLQLTGGSFTCPDPAPPRNEPGHAIEAISAIVRGGVDMGWESVGPSVDFTDAATTFLADDPASWPRQYVIAGLTYDRFEMPQGGQPRNLWDHAARCAWLSGQTTFDSGSYEQAAQVFRRHGYTAGAEQILMAQRRHARQAGRSSSTWPRRVGLAAYATVGYGYRPWRVLWMLAALLVLVAGSLQVPAWQATLRATNGNGDVYGVRGLLVTSAGQARPEPGTAARPPVDSCGDGEVRCFSPWLYAVDTVVPLISLDQRSTWYPDPHLRDGKPMLIWLNIASLLGWLLSSVLALSLARLSRSP